MSNTRSDILRLHDILDALSAIRRHPVADKYEYERWEYRVASPLVMGDAIYHHEVTPRPRG